MSKPRLFFLFVLIVFFCHCSEKKQSDPATNIEPEPPSAPGKSNAVSETVDIKVGSGLLKTAVFKTGSGFPLYFNLHSDEQTSVEAARKVIFDDGGTLVKLNSDGDRLIKFTVNNHQYSFDPNRIFTPLGIQKTLKKYDSFTPETEKAVSDFAKKVVADFLTDPKLIIALHNNTNDNYSILSYTAGQEFEKDAAQVYINPEQDIDNFFFVTDEKIFRFLKEKKFNVILQDNRNVVDDGSLSVYCGKNKITYINVEAEHNHLNEQITMLQNLKEIIADPNLQ